MNASIQRSNQIKQTVELRPAMPVFFNGLTQLRPALA